VKLKDLITLKEDDQDADFWIIRRGAANKVGKPTKEYSRWAWGVTVKDSAKSLIIPQYLFYMLEYVWNSGYYKNLATGSTKLVNIKKTDILNLKVG